MGQVATKSHNTLVKLFFRLYAGNRRRSWRNNTKDAWSDAIYTMDTLIALPVLSLSMALWVIVIRIFPTTIGVTGIPKGALVLLVLSVGFVVDAIFAKYIDKYHDVPIAHDSFSGTADRAAIVIAFVISFVTFLLMLGLVIMLSKRH